MIRLLAAVFLITAFFPAAAAGDIFKYESRGKRDPFVPLIGQDKSTRVGLSDVSSIDDVKLEGIAAGPGGSNTAIINGEIVREGYKQGEISIIRIDAKSVKLSLGGKEFKVNLPDEGGPQSE